MHTPVSAAHLDISAALEHQRAGSNFQDLGYGFFGHCWLAIFIVTQIMAWIVLPIEQEYDNAGEFTVGARIKHSVKENVKMYVILGIVAIALMSYIVFLKNDYAPLGIMSLCLAAANAFGLFLLVIFLSCGLVGVPRCLWRMADVSYMLRTKYFEAVNLDENFEIARLELTEMRIECVSLDPRVAETEKPLLSGIIEQIDLVAKTIPLTGGAKPEDLRGRLDMDQLLIEVSSRVKIGIKRLTRLRYQWQKLVGDCILYDNLVNGRFGNVSDPKRLYWVNIHKPLFRLLAICCRILTMLVLWCELIVPFQTVSIVANMSVIQMAVVDPTFGFFGSFIFLGYMAGVSYWTIFEFKALDGLTLVRGHSDGASLCFTATFLMRLILPLCYNFLWISNLTDPAALVTYSSMFGSMNVVDFLGEWFNRFIPIFIPIMVALIETKFWDILLEQLGIDRTDPGDLDNEVAMNRVQDGKQIVSQKSRVDLAAVL